jgi:phosphoesterase RecJ-like protein
MPAEQPASALWAACAAARRILLTGPMYPDGDSIGACLALARGLRILAPDTHTDVVGDISFRYSWMPGADEIMPDHALTGAAPYDLAIVLDGDRTRLEPPVAAAFDKAGTVAIIDHHSSTTPEGYDIALIDPDSASTCEMVYGLLEPWGVPLTMDLAALLYTGLIFDTGGFRHSNTTADTHRFAATLLDTGIVHTPINIRVLMERRPAGLKLLGQVLSEATFHADGQIIFGVIDEASCTRLGAEQGDVEGIVDAMVFTQGVELACVCVEKGPERVKLSLRSRSGVDVAALARSLSPGGGGHPRAAGVILAQPLSTLRQTLPDRLAAAFPCTATEAG